MFSLVIDLLSKTIVLIIDMPYPGMMLEMLLMLRYLPEYYLDLRVFRLNLFR